MSRERVKRGVEKGTLIKFKRKLTSLMIQVYALNKPTIIGLCA
jgi:hypothetical protein